EFSNEKLVCYAEVLDDHNKCKEFNEILTKFISFYQILFELSLNTVFIASRECDGKMVCSYDEYVQYVVDAMKEMPLCTIAFPSLKVCTLTGYDLTHSFYILKNGSNQENDIKGRMTEIANSVGLYVI